jgi:hypothetical protein
VRAPWVDAGNDPDYAKVRACGADSLYFDIRDPRVTIGYLDAVKAQGYGVGVYFRENWPEVPKLPAAAAAWLSGKLSPLDRGPDFPMVCLDIETHDIQGYVLPFLREWRRRRQKRRTDWTLEGFQGGLFTPQDVSAIAAYIIGEGSPGYICPSNYGGSMQPFAADRVALDLVAAGFTHSILKGMNDAASLGERWDGYAFTQGRLP